MLDVIKLCESSLINSKRICFDSSSRGQISLQYDCYKTMVITPYFIKTATNVSLYMTVMEMWMVGSYTEVYL